MEAVETIEYMGHTIEIDLMPYIENPRKDWDPLATLLHPRDYEFGKDDRPGYCIEMLYDEYDMDYSEPIEKLERKLKKDYYYLPLSINDYGSSGIWVYERNLEKANAILMVSKKDVKEEWGNLSKKTIGIVRSNLHIEAQMIDAWGKGEYYGFSIEDLGESCGGFWGYRRLDWDYMIETAKEAIEYHYPLLAEIKDALA